MNHSYVSAEQRPNVGASQAPARRLLAADDGIADELIRALMGRFRPFRARTLVEARQKITELQPSVVITELALPDGDGVEVCRLAKAMSHPPLVMVTTANLQRVPAAIAAGCNAVLIKPYSVNLVCTRLARLLQLFESAMNLNQRRAAANVSTMQSPVATASTNRRWDDVCCPTCGRPGATSFDFFSHRRMWCACLACEHVWLAQRRE